MVLGDWLVSSDSRSRLCVFSLEGALSQQAFSSPSRPLSAFISLKNPVFALNSFKNILICGDSRGNLFGYQWASLKNFVSPLTEPKRIFEVNHFSSAGEGLIISNEINTVASVNDKILYGGAGGSAIRLLDPERPDKVFKFIVVFKSLLRCSYITFSNKAFVFSAYCNF